MDYWNIPTHAPKMKPLVDYGFDIRYSANPKVDQPTDEEKARWHREERELWERERKYLHEFDLKSCKFVTKMTDLTIDEIKWWKQHLDDEVMSGIIDDNDIDFFNKQSFIYTEEIRVMEWIWHHDDKIDILIDMNAWPGDNETGLIILDNQIVLHNNDQSISATDLTNEELCERMDAFERIRIQRCTEDNDYDDNHPEHKHCEKIKIKYEKELEI